MAGKWNSFCRILQRRRVFEPDQLDSGNLKRCLSVWDLTALGVGSSLGVGVYVLIGSVARHLAGPSIVLSFLIAAVAAVFAGMCYAEFGSRVPKAGSAYIYTYVAVGEFVAFIIGWDMILEAVFGTASVARGLSMYVDSMTNNTMSVWFESFAPMASANFSPYFDFFAFFIVIILGVLLAFGVRESTLVNNVFTAVNIVVILFIIFAGAFKADVNNWSIAPEPRQENENRGEGGFFPFGVWGMLKGAAVCFYGFVGFDSISSTGEEVRDPRRAIPLSIMSTQVIVFVVYAAVATVVTMMMPYYLQEKVASVATAFTYVGMDWARWIVTVGAVVGITASLYGSMFPLPRLLYSMATDGLLIHWFARVTTKRKSPMIATLVSTVIIAILAAILELNELILMMCIGTLLSYTVVACCVIILRYRSASISESSYVKQILGLGLRSPTKATSFIMNISLLLFICTCVTSGLVIHHVEYPIVYIALLHSIALFLIVVMAMQPQLKEELTFKTPLVPLVPCLSIYVNINLMMLIKLQTWIRVVVWMAIGIPVYFLCVCFYKQNVKHNLQDNINASGHMNVNGKAPVQIYVVSPTPPDTISRSNKGDEIIKQDDRIQVIDEKSQEDIAVSKVPFVTEEILVQHAYYEDNEEKEAKIIDLLDQVLQAEEDSYAEILSLKENNEEENVTKEQENIIHRKSLSDLSDAGSDASMGNQVLSKYDVIAEVHREDLPRVNEEEERSDRETEINQENDDIIEYEDITAFNDSDTNSQTDESGYSDTIDKTVLCESIDNLKDEEPKIPVPPPLDENFFVNPSFKKSYTISVRPPKPRTVDSDDESKNMPRASVQSNSSYDDTPMVFGSDKQMSFMSKLNNIFQNKIEIRKSENDEQTHRRRSNSTGNAVENNEFALNRGRPPIFLDLKNEIISQKVAQNLRPLNVEQIKQQTDDEDTDTSLSREDLKLKLESLFAAGGPKLSKSRVMKSNPPTPEESYQTDTSSTESISNIPKIEKNDTLGRQRTKFGEVLNSFRLTLNKEDDV
ncbi:cationic amino acid transporter 2-like [Nymphalis io]|uniref:cationic amino acid transporter 2-like n=1 Tax=Inachis io TaxID=171585 RepID=UPI0021675624|nr:cationic amino acid transporter 2-like [Nymphalis io]XP_050350878.1 cationic amino acid transporter 2-like [Nymphalis io]